MDGASRPSSQRELPTMPATSWTFERVQMLRTLWAQGLSASQIARRLAGGVTRNAIIGKVHRLGLSGRAKPPPGVTRPPTQVVKRRRRAPAEPSLAVVTPAALPMGAEEHGLATMLTVGPRACRWPFGDPLASGFSLCGRPCCRGAYCAPHGARAYRRPEAGHLLKLAVLRR